MDRDEQLREAVQRLEDAFIELVREEETPDIKSIKEYLGMAKTIKELRELLSGQSNQVTVRFEEHTDWAE